MHHPTDRIAHTTAFVTPVVEHWLEREMASTLESNYTSVNNRDNKINLNTSFSYVMYLYVHACMRVCICIDV